MTWSNRFEQARFLADNGFVKIRGVDGKGRVTNAIVPGHQSRQYEVILRRPKSGRIINTECLLNLGHGDKPCEGGKYTVCYHSIAALIASANELDVEVSFCNNQADADRLTNLGGEVHTVYSFKGNKPLWMVFERPEVEAEVETEGKKKSAEEIMKELGF